LQILEDELQQNFRISGEELESAGKDKETVEVRVVPPPVKIKIKRISTRYEMRDKALKDGFSLELENYDTSRYKLIHIEQQGLQQQTSAASIRRED
jgi:hypothetical protein